MYLPMYVSTYLHNLKILHLKIPIFTVSCTHYVAILMIDDKCNTYITKENDI